METYPPYPSYPDSGNSSPRSREIDFDAAPWDDQQPNSGGGGGGGGGGGSYKVKFMCSYGGKIHPRPHDNQLSYIGGETKILSVDRHIKLSSFLSKLSSLCDLPDGVSFKYQLPGEDLDALISVTTDDDLEHMMHEYDRLYRACSRPARMRLFLFPVHPQPPPAAPAAAADPKSDRERFVEALNSGPAVQEPAKPPPSNVDFLFGLDKGVVAGAPPAVAAAVPDPVVAAVQEGRVGIPRDERVVAPDHGVNPLEIQRQLQELQRMQISCGGGQAQDAAMYRRKSDENVGNAGGYGADNYYLQKLAQEKTQQMAIPAAVPHAATAPPGYWQQEKQPSGGFTAAVTGPPEQPMYMIPGPAPGTIYHAPPQMMRQMAAGQGYYTLPQRVSPDVYRDQPVYNVVHPPSQAPPLSAAAPPSLPPQTQLHRVAAASSEGLGVGAMRHGGGGGGADTVAYAQLPYDSGVGRQVFYTAAGGMVVPPPPQYQGMAAVSASDMRQGGGAVLNQEGKVIGTKVSQGSL
ncbi:LOW QUALITY PROTEIN: uncharacterized protein LOC104419850 [Eucalyptus grandis]|uniref:LOW QUALITY PROTEIN: uncharacterized protein LOC104419850 n=1 Tax=Eucalyptus grandis TaxID=71139 RepID=UPI00192E789C|nr:LOW QUALITY PROTEIN: uncharacterized protein LOC104419850 [Eucalyptus grandis]